MPLDRQCVPLGSPEEGHPTRGHLGKPQLGQETGSKGKCGKSLCCGSRGKEDKAGQTGLGSASENNFGGFWGMGIVLSCLGPGLWVTWEGE